MLSRDRLSAVNCMPSNITHGIVNTGESTLQVIEVFHPVREDFLDKIK